MHSPFTCVFTVARFIFIKLFSFNARTLKRRRDASARIIVQISLARSKSEKSASTEDDRVIYVCLPENLERDEREELDAKGETALPRSEMVFGEVQRASSISRHQPSRIN